MTDHSDDKPPFPPLRRPPSQAGNWPQSNHGTEQYPGHHAPRPPARPFDPDATVDTDERPPLSFDADATLDNDDTNPRGIVPPELAERGRSQPAPRQPPNDQRQAVNPHQLQPRPAAPPRGTPAGPGRPNPQDGSAGQGPPRTARLPPQPGIAQVLGEAHALSQLGAVPDSTAIVTLSTGYNELEVMGKPLAVKNPRRLVFFVSIALGLASTGALAIAVLREWTPPSRIALFALLAVGFVAAVTSTMTATIWQRGARGAMIGGLWGLVASLGTPVIALAWATPQFRAALLRDWDGRSLTLHDALEDPSDDVKAAACSAILARGEVKGRSLLLPLLTTRPAAAEECFRGHTDESSQELASEVARRWSRQLTAESSDSEELAQMGVIASAMAVLPIPQAEIDVRLLHCTFTAPTEEARKYCSDVLSVTATPADWPKRLSDIAGKTGDGELAAGVTAMAFHQRGLTAEQAALAKRLDASSDASKWSTIELAGYAIGEGGIEPIPILASLLDENCDVDPAGVPRSRAIWYSVTAAAIESRKDFPKPQEAICRGAVQVILAGAIGNAGALFHAAIQTKAGKEDARSIDGGWLMINGDAPQTRSELRKYVPPGMNEEQAQKVIEMYSQNPEYKNHPGF